jgi:hypothetical protein
MWRRTESGNLEVMDSDGRMVPARFQRCLGEQVRHQTVCGQWLPKFVAVSKGLQLTGKEKFVIISQLAIVPDKKKIRKRQAICNFNKSID